MVSWQSNVGHENKTLNFFEFVAFERKYIIKNGRIRFSPIAQFNNPFELEPTITPLSRKFLEYISRITEEEIVNIEYSEEGTAGVGGLACSVNAGVSLGYVGSSAGDAIGEWGGEQLYEIFGN